METVLDLLNELEETLDNSRAVPFSNRVSVDKEELYEIITEIRMKLPNELKQSKWVIEERNKILHDIDILNQLVKDKELKASQFEEAAQERLRDMDKLTSDNDILKREADKRLADVEQLTEENNVLQQEADKRLEDVKKLLSENEVLAQAASERLAIIERMNSM